MESFEGVYCEMIPDLLEKIIIYIKFDKK